MEKVVKKYHLGITAQSFMSNFKITIPKPCSASWANMKPLEQGRFCESCEKEVIDFTKFSNQDLANWFKQDKGMTCGRLSPKQLDHLIVTTSNFSLKRFKPSLIAASLVALLTFPKLSLANTKLSHPTLLFEGKSQSEFLLPVQKSDSVIVIKGSVIDKENKEPIIGLSIVTKKGRLIGTTDANGKFEIKIDRNRFSKKEILEFRYIGYDTKTIKVNLNKASLILIEMKISTSILGELAIVRNKSSFEKLKDFFNA